MVNIAANMLGAKTEELSEAEGILFFKIKSILESFNFSVILFNFCEELDDLCLNDLFFLPFMAYLISAIEFLSY